MEWKKGLITGIVAGVVLIVIGSAFMIVPGITEWYSATFPQFTSSGGDCNCTTPSFGVMISTLVAGLFMGLVYSVINSAVPGTGARKGVNYGIMVWLLAGLMWPIMMTGFAPVYIWVIELINGLITYSITGAVIAIIYKKLSNDGGASRNSSKVKSK